MKKQCILLVLASVLCTSIALSVTGPVLAEEIPKFSIELIGPPPVYIPINGTTYTVTTSKFYQQMLPVPLPSTPVFGYGGLAKDSISGELLGVVQSVPGPTFEVVRYNGAWVNWVNNITDPHIFAVDPTIHWANPNKMQMPVAPFVPFPPGYPNAQKPVPVVTHLHGMETRSDSDGHPNAWFTSTGIHGPAFHSYENKASNSALFYYPNQQQGTTLWYHDHTLGISRLNNLAGLTGFYILRDPKDTIALLLPNGSYDVPLLLQDRSFNTTDGTVIFPSVGANPDIHPYWLPEYFGDVIMVNGRAWPNMKVDRGQYMFRILDGSNARFYNLSFVIGLELLPFTIIGSDGGYMREAVKDVATLIIAPAERYTVLVDFSNLSEGTHVIMQNSANAPFPNGDPVNNETTAIVMQFTVQAKRGHQPQQLPLQLNPALSTFPSLPPPRNTRILTLAEKINEASDSPLASFLNGQPWNSVTSEMPLVGSTEEWSIIDLTEDAHPIHVHAAQFQIVKRQPIDVDSYNEKWEALNGIPPVNVSTQLDPTPYLIGSARGPELIEQCWKDVVIVYPGEVTVIRVRFGPQDGTEYPFDATTEPGYIWHCHILDHEDNEMMRPMKLVHQPNTELPLWIIGLIVLGCIFVIVIFLLLFLTLHYRRMGYQKIQ